MVIAQTQVAVAAEQENWTSTITPHRGWFDWRLKQLWRYRDLIALFVWRDFVSVYKQTILGPAWHIIQPLLMTLTFTIIFGKVAKLSTNGVSPFLFYLVGTVFWNYFANNLTKTSTTFVSNAPLLGKVYFHRLAIPISIAISNLITLGIQLGIFLVCFAFQYLRGSNVHFTRWILLTPLFPFDTGGVRPWWGNHRFCSDDPLSRPGKPGYLWRDAGYVRDTCDLSPFGGAAAISLADAAESSRGPYGGISAGISWRGQCRYGAPRGQLRHHACRTCRRIDAVYPRRAHLLGYCLKYVHSYFG